MRYIDVTSPLCTQTEWGLAPVCIEEPHGRQSYREQQEELMRRVEPVRAALLVAYDEFLRRRMPELTGSL